MIKIKANGTIATVEETERLTSGRVGLPISLDLSEEWEGLLVTVVCSAGGVVKDVAVLPGADLTVPHECLVKSGVRLTIGIYGATQDGHIVIPTIYADAGKIYRGADPSGEEEHDPTPSEVEQILAAASEAVTVAQSVRDDADAGEFDGSPGADGPQGPAGVGVPRGGTAGQVLKKKSDDDYDTEWGKGGGGAVNSVNNKTGAVTLDGIDVSAVPQVTGEFLYNGGSKIEDPKWHNKTVQCTTDYQEYQAWYFYKIRNDGDGAVRTDVQPQPDIPQIEHIQKSGADLDDTNEVIVGNIYQCTSNYSNNHSSIANDTQFHQGYFYLFNGEQAQYTYTRTDTQPVPTNLSDLNSDSNHRLVTDAEKVAWNGKADKIVYDYDQSFTVPNDPSSTIYIELPTVGLTEFRLTITTPEAVVATSTGYFYLSTGMNGNVMNNRGRFFEPVLTQSHSTTHDIVFYPGRGGLYDMYGYRYGNTNDTDYSLFTHYTLTRQNLGRSFFASPEPIKGIWFTVSGSMSDLAGTTIRIRGLKYVANN